MSDRFAFGFAATIWILLAVSLLLGFQTHVVLGKLLVAKIEWLAFWR